MSRPPSPRAPVIVLTRCEAAYDAAAAVENCSDHHHRNAGFAAYAAADAVYTAVHINHINDAEDTADNAAMAADNFSAEQHWQLAQILELS